MNIIELQERLKDLPEQALMQEMQMPTGTAPQFLVLSELKRRKRMRDDYQRQQAQGMQTVAEETITAAGMPQGGIMDAARAMAPRSAIAQDTGVNDMIQREATRAPQPEQPTMMASGGYVQRMQEGGFSGRQQQGYLIFLEDMGLQDSPESRDMYVRTMERQQERGVSPTTFMPFIDRAPEAVSLADVSTDVGAFMPGAETQPPRMTAPVLGPAPSAGTIDFDASIAELPSQPAPREPESSLATLGRITGEAADVARGMGIGIASLPEMPKLSFPEINLPQSLRGEGIEGVAGVGDIEYGGFYPEGEGASDAGISAAEELAGINQRLSDPNISERQRSFLENRKSILETQVQAGEIPSWLMEQINRGAAGVRGALDPLIAGGMSYFDPEAAESFAERGEAAAETFSSLAEREAEDRRRRLEAAGIVDGGDTDAVPPPVEDQALSFGLPPADLPTTGAELSFGGITPSAADIPLSTGREGAAEPTPEFPLGTPVEAPAAAISSATGRTGGGGTGGGAYGGIESRIARMLEEREKSAEADKWLALAQTGLALMASNQPTIGGAIGEAGLAGIGAMQKARSQYDKDIMALLDMQAGVQRARAAGARAGASGTGTASATERAAYFRAANEAEAEVARLERELVLGGEVGEFGEIVRPYSPEELALLERQLNSARSRASVYSGLSNPALATIQAMNE